MVCFQLFSTCFYVEMMLSRVLSYCFYVETGLPQLLSLCFYVKNRLPRVFLYHFYVEMGRFQVFSDYLQLQTMRKNQFQPIHLLINKRNVYFRKQHVRRLCILHRLFGIAGAGQGNGNTRLTLNFILSTFNPHF